MPGTLQRLTLRGFKTVESLDDFQPQSISVLIGPNGAGKSNFISFFRLLSWMTSPPGNLQLHVGAQGGASAILHGGPARTREVVARLTLATDRGDNEYQFRLFHAAGDTLIFAEEQYRYSRNSLHTRASWKDLGAGHREAGLIERAETGDQTARTILSLLRKLVVYQFHNTSTTARMRNKWHLDDGRWLKEDAANLASFLFRLRLDEPELGLHPYAINVIAGLIRAAATRVQVILATQSVSLIDHFDPSEIVVVEREGASSAFRRLGEEDLREWLEEAIPGSSSMTVRTPRHPTGSSRSFRSTEGEGCRPLRACHK